MRDIKGVVWHHTATGPQVSDAQVDSLLRNGRSDLPGPLSQLGLRRDGTFVVVAAGRCNHNGYGLWGNDSIGIEAYNSGLGEPWPAAQLNAYHLGTAAICRHLRLDPATQVKGHRETDPRRKIDPTGIDMDAARRRIAELLRPAAPSKPIPRPKDPDMRMIQSDKAQGGDGAIYGMTGFHFQHLSPSEVAQYASEGIRVEPTHPWIVAAMLLKAARVGVGRSAPK